MRVADLVMVAAALGLMGCAAEVEGEWESEGRIGGKRSEMAVFGDGTGEAKLYFTSSGDLNSEKFDFSWEERGSGRFDLDMDCQSSTLVQGNCAAADFTMDCHSASKGDELDCDGSDSYQNFSWTFERID